MKQTVSTLLFIVSTFVLSCSPEQECPEGINLLPMYGHVPKCDEQTQDDNQFIAECDAHFPSRKVATQYHVDKGWAYFYQDDLETAMKRFNQAWLLDSTNADIYWGFGNVLGKQGKLDESIVYFGNKLPATIPPIKRDYLSQQGRWQLEKISGN